MNISPKRRARDSVNDHSPALKVPHKPLSERRAAIHQDKYWIVNPIPDVKREYAYGRTRAKDVNYWDQKGSPQVPYRSKAFRPLRLIMRFGLGDIFYRLFCHVARLWAGGVSRKAKGGS
jgi:hypothetical protein